MKTFEVELTYEVDPAKLRWPSRAEVAFDANPAGNHHYQDLRGLTWREVEQALTLERRLILQVEGAADPAAEELRIADGLAEAAEIDAAHPLRGVDLGVASAVFVLSALGAIPAASCNGGAFGSFHQASSPYIAFFIRPRRLHILAPWVRAAGLGMTMTTDGIVVLHGRRVTDFCAFAAIALDAQAEGERALTRKQ